MRPSGPALAFAVILILAAPALLSSVAAEHVYAHRYVVMGRVVDADGNPVQGLGVPVGKTGFRGDYCAGTSGKTGITDVEGTFWYCFHTHALDESDAVRVRVAGEEFVKPVDRDLRVSTFLVYAPEGVNGTARDAANRSYVVAGKLWQGTEEGLYDGVPVTGVALADVNVTVRLSNATNATIGTRNVTTNGFGEYVARVPLPENATLGNVTVTAADAARTLPASPVFLFTRADVKWPGSDPHPDVEPLPDPDVDAAFPGAPTDPARVSGAPGASAPPFVGSPAFYYTLLVAAAALVGAGAYAKRRRDVVVSLEDEDSGAP